MGTIRPGGRLAIRSGNRYPLTRGVDQLDGFAAICGADHSDSAQIASIEALWDKIGLKKTFYDRSLKRPQIKMTPMYHWQSRRVEAHVKICVLALMIERIAELSCGKPWPTIRRALDKLQVTKFINFNQRVYLRNEISIETRNILKKLDIKPPKQLVQIENGPQN